MRRYTLHSRNELHAPHALQPVQHYFIIKFSSVYLPECFSGFRVRVTCNWICVCTNESMEGLLDKSLVTLFACSGNVAADVRHMQKTNSTSGCHSYTLDITAQAQDCQHPQLIGVDEACQSTCALVSSLLSPSRGAGKLPAFAIGTHIYTGRRVLLTLLSSRTSRPSRLPPCS